MFCIKERGSGKRGLTPAGKPESGLYALRDQLQYDEDKDDGYPFIHEIYGDIRSHLCPEYTELPAA